MIDCAPANPTICDRRHRQTWLPHLWSGIGRGEIPVLTTTFWQTREIIREWRRRARSRRELAMLSRLDRHDLACRFRPARGTAQAVLAGLSSAMISRARFWHQSWSRVLGLSQAGRRDWLYSCPILADKDVYTLGYELFAGRTHRPQQLHSPSSKDATPALPANSSTRLRGDNCTSSANGATVGARRRQRYDASDGRRAGMTVQRRGQL